MILIYKHSYTGAPYNCPINHFNGRESVRREEVVVKTKVVSGKEYTYAEPAIYGMWAFGGTILFTSNGFHPEFNVPLKLHDRNLLMEDIPFEETE